MKAIVLTDNIIADALESGASVSDALHKSYEGEIADRIKQNPQFAKLDAIQMAMMDAGISKKSLIKTFYANPQNEWLFPAFVDKRLAETIGGNDILSHIVGGQTVINSTSVQGASVDLVNDEGNKDSAKLKRVAEGADLPLATIKLGKNAITLAKFGRALEATYEALQYQSVEMFSRAIGWIANDAAHQQVENAISVLISGDGNGNAAVADECAEATLVTDDLIRFALNFWKANHTPLTTIIAGDDMYLALQKMTVAANAAGGIIPSATFNFPQGIVGDVTVLYENVPTAGAKAQLIGLSKDFALTKYVAAGSQIRQLSQNIRNQTNLGTISEIAGFAKFVNSASRVLKMK